MRSRVYNGELAAHGSLVKKMVWPNEILPDLATSVAIVGGGVAGMWTGYQLAKARIPSVVIVDHGASRGGVQGASRRSAGAINLLPLQVNDLPGYLQELGRGQTHPHVAGIMNTHLEQALSELEALVQLKAIKLGKALSDGKGAHLLSMLESAYRKLGGRVVEGWVTQLAATGGICKGVQYQAGTSIGKVRCRAVILASGGYAGMLGNATRTNCYGAMIGRFFHCGGVLSNLEFVFKHGYGDIDANGVTPTEELPGAEIKDATGVRVMWLEELLFEQQGTHNHLRAAQFWSKNAERTFYVDLTYRQLYSKLWAYRQALQGARSHEEHATSLPARDELFELFPTSAWPAVNAHLQQAAIPDFSVFERLKPLSASAPQRSFRIAAVAYFTMGGIAHAHLRTSLRGVYVTGEAMHDFGANRVGGLPWALYLSAGRALRYLVARDLASGAHDNGDFELQTDCNDFDLSLVDTARTMLTETLESGLKREPMIETREWLRTQRSRLRSRTGCDDTAACLLLAEAILASSLCRNESRGFFYREDCPDEDQSMHNLFSRAYYNSRTDQIQTALCTSDKLERDCAQAWRDEIGSLYRGAERASEEASS